MSPRPRQSSGALVGAIVTLLSAGAAKEYLRGVVLEDPPLGIRRELTAELSPYMEYFGMVLQLKQTANSVEEITAACASSIRKP